VPMECRMRAGKRIQGSEDCSGADCKSPAIPRIISHTRVIKMMTAARIAFGTAVLAACGMKTPFLLLIVLKKCGQVRHMNIAVLRKKSR
jgi:hypothetical protein